MFLLKHFKLSEAGFNKRGSAVVRNSIRNLKTLTRLPMMLLLTSVSSWMRAKEGLPLSCRRPSWCTGDMHGVMSGRRQMSVRSLRLQTRYTETASWLQNELALTFVFHTTISDVCILDTKPSLNQPAVTGAYQQGCYLGHSPTLGRCLCPTAQKKGDPERFTHIGWG